jgi:Toprim-like
MTSNVEDTLETLGLKVISIRGSEIQLHCPAHKERTGKEDNNPSFWINGDNGLFICFSCDWKGGIRTLVSYLGGGIANIDDMDVTVSRLTSRIKQLIQGDKPKQEELNPIHESMLLAFKPVPEDVCRSRGLLPQAVDKYGVKWNALQSNWIIPIRDPISNSLLGWQEKGHKSRFFRNTTGVKKSEALFGYEHYKGGDMIVVESPLDVIRLASLGIDGGVAVYGCAVSDTQWSMIRGASRAIFALDNDDAGRKVTEDLRFKAIDMGMSCWFFNYAETDQKDVGGMSRKEIEWGLKNARHILGYMP